MSYSVYAVVEKCTGRVKVGHCETRYLGKVGGGLLYQLQRGNPDDLSLVEYYEYPTKREAKAAEGFAHNELKKARGRLHIRGEWYKPPALDLLEGILEGPLYNVRQTARRGLDNEKRCQTRGGAGRRRSGDRAFN